MVLLKALAIISVNTENTINIKFVIEKLAKLVEYINITTITHTDVYLKTIHRF